MPSIRPMLPPQDGIFSILGQSIPGEYRFSGVLVSQILRMREVGPEEEHLVAQSGHQRLHVLHRLDGGEPLARG